jgi:hypothetical protein
MTGLACKKCSSCDTVVCRAKQLADRTGDRSFVITTAGVVSPDILLAILSGILAAIRAASEYLGSREKNNPPVIVCKGCGYWERMTTDSA